MAQWLMPLFNPDVRVFYRDWSDRLAQLHLRAVQAPTGPEQDRLRTLRRRLLYGLAFKRICDFVETVGIIIAVLAAFCLLLIPFVESEWVAFSPFMLALGISFKLTAKEAGTDFPEQALVNESPMSYFFIPILDRDNIITYREWISTLRFLATMNVQTMPPDDADSIMRHQRRVSMGIALKIFWDVAETAGLLLIVLGGLKLPLFLASGMAENLMALPMVALGVGLCILGHEMGVLYPDQALFGEFAEADALRAEYYMGMQARANGGMNGNGGLYAPPSLRNDATIPVATAAPRSKEEYKDSFRNIVSTPAPMLETAPG